MLIATKNWSALPLLAVALLAAATAQAAPDAAHVFPANSVGFFAAEDTPDLLDRWSRTLVGRLASDPTMRPFVEQVEGRLRQELGAMEDRIGLTPEDLRDAAAGEAAVAVVKPSGKGERGRLAAVVDASGREAAAKDLLGKLDARLTERGAAKSAAEGLTVYTLPADRAKQLPERTVAVFHDAGRVGAAEDTQIAAAMRQRVLGDAAGQTLADVEAFEQTQSRARRAAKGAATSIAWFVSPFEFEAASRPTPKPNDLPTKKETLAILAEQGFDAVTGIGGVVSVAATPERDFVHHTYFYAPPKPGAESKHAAEKYERGMRMLELPNNAAQLTADNPPVETWAPRQLATYKTLHLDIENAFEHLGSLFDAFAGYEGAFKNILTGLEKDPYGPKINVATEVIPHLGKRAVVMTDYTLPITTECERYLVVVDVTDEEALRDPLDRWLESDGAERKELEGVPYWEMVPEEEAFAQDDYDPLDPLAPIGQPATSQRGEREERVLRRAAVCVHKGRLVIGSDAEFLRQALFGVSSGESLSGSADIRALVAALSEVAPGDRCAWTVSRNDEAFRPTYELVRQGKMPESETFLGRLLNRLLTSDEEREVDAIRRQRIQGQKLPSFELARRYFGPSARSVRSESDGWLVSGVVLNKAPELGAVARAGR